MSLTNPQVGDTYDILYPPSTLHIKGVSPYQNDTVIHIDGLNNQIPLRSWPHYVTDRQGNVWLGENVEGTIQELLDLDSNEIECLGVYDNSVCFVTKEKFIKMSSPGIDTVEESIQYLWNEYDFHHELMTNGAIGVLPCSWHQYKEKAFLVKPRCSAEPLNDRQQQIAEQIKDSFANLGIKLINPEWGAWNTIPVLLNVSHYF